jgi:general secretion pathway protein C
MSEALSDFFLRHRLARPLALASIAALVALILLLLARTAWTLLDLGAPAPPAPIVAAAAPLAAPTTSLARWHLFGNAAPSADPRSLAANAPDTVLALSLRGVLAGADPGSGVAIIADAQGGERSYSVGATLPGDATLEAVYPDRIALRRNGVLESLRLRTPEDTSAPGSAAGRLAFNPQNTAPAPSLLPGANAAPAPFITPSIAPMGADFAAITQQLGVDPVALARQVSVLPVMENGRFVGVRLVGARDVPVIAKLGLEPDDLVTAVNGIALDSPQRAQEVARSLASASAVNVTVRRNGKTETLSASLR